jgi:hypothetical protein
MQIRTIGPSGVLKYTSSTSNKLEAFTAGNGNVRFIQLVLLVKVSRKWSICLTVNNKFYQLMAMRVTQVNWLILWYFNMIIFITLSWTRIINYF